MEENSIDISTVKLIIWDLDNTFWSGVVSQNNSKIVLDKQKIEFIKTLINCGIMNSICSKNNFHEVRKIFTENNLDDVWDCFIFPSINWEGKGQRVKNIIEKMQLREQNVLFIDDNSLNLEEVKFYNSEIQTAFPDIIPNLVQQISGIEQKDKEHSRLRHYKILEEKNRQKNIIGSNEKFLFSSHINVEFNSDCLENVERITELINRTNQLNYTKNRMGQDEVVNLLKDNDIESRYVCVKDKFGDYGICGFYSFDKLNDRIIHLLFSCRIMGMGIEQYVYSYLNYPNVDVVGDVSVSLKKNKKCEWINQNLKTAEHKRRKTNSDYKILFKGPCDLRGAADYVAMDYDNFTLDFSYLDEEGMIKDNACRLINVANSHRLSDDVKKIILKDATFITKELYNQPIFNDKYDIIVFSLLLDATSRIYLHKETSEKIAWNSYAPFTEKENYNNFINFQEAGAKSIWSEEQLKSCIGKFEHIGFMPPEEIIENIDYIINSVDKNTKWIFIVGSDVKPSEEQLKSYFYRLRYKRRKEINPTIIKYLKKKKNVEYIELSKLVKSNQDYLDSMDHFVREVYFKLSKQIVKKINKLSKNNLLKMKAPSKIRKNVLFFRKIKLKLDNLYNKLSRLIFVIKLNFFD